MSVCEQVFHHIPIIYTVGINLMRLHPSARIYMIYDWLLIDDSYILRTLVSRHYAIMTMKERGVYNRGEWLYLDKSTLMLRWWLFCACTARMWRNQTRAVCPPQQRENYTRVLSKLCVLNVNGIYIYMNPRVECRPRPLTATGRFMLVQHIWKAKKHILLWEIFWNKNSKFI